VKRFEIVLPSELVQIPGIELLEPIGRGAESLVFRARRGHQIVAVKLHRDEGAGEDRKEAYLRLRREAAILGCLRHPSLASLIALGEVQSRPYIVMEYVPGVTLRSRLDRSPLEEREVRSLGRQLAGALAEIHRHGLVHRDITPKNVILDPKGGAKLIDLGFVARVAKGIAHERVKGTFGYTAPEQSGVLHRPVDGRSDLYALGVLLFEATIGKPPFENEDPGELIYQHAVVPPPSAQALAPQVSATLSSMIAKLLAKDPDDRYQSAESFIADLDRFEELEAQAHQGKRLLGELETGPSNAYEAALVGRQGELARLTEAWSGVQAGSGAVVVLEGEPGSGKTRLAQEIMKRASADERHPLVLAGKCSENVRVPFGPFRDAIDHLLECAHTLPIEERKRLEKSVRDAAIELGPSIKHFSPGISALLSDVAGPSSPAPSQDGFCELVSALFSRLARHHGGMLLFIDELDWATVESREILLRLARRARDAPLLLIVAVRAPGESGSEAQRLLEELGPIISSRIVLGPLEEGALRALIAAHLGGLPPDERAIRQISGRSSRNPQVAIEYLRAMLDAGVLWPSFGSWTVDEEALANLDLPKDLLELLFTRIRSLSEAARAVIAAAAVWGESFEVPQLLRISGTGIQVIHDAIQEATRARLLERSEGAKYAFVHHRVQEAFLATLSPEEAMRLHQKSAEVLTVSGGDSDAEVYARARHWCASDRTVHPNMVYEAAFAAGKRALSKFANVEAQRFLKEAVDVASRAGIHPDPSLAEALGEAYSRVGDLEEARVQLERALQVFRDPMRRAVLRVQLAEIALSSGDLDEAEQEAKRAFAEIGHRFPKRTRFSRASSIWQCSRVAVSERILSTPHRPGTKLELARVLADLYGLAAQLYDALLCSSDRIAALARQLRASRELGPSRELVRSHAAYADAMAVAGRSKSALAHAKQALALADEIQDRESFARSILAFAHIRHVTGDARAAESLARRALDDLGVWLEVQDHASACVDLAFNLLVRGYPREAWAWLERIPPRREIHGACAGSVLALLGRSSESHQHFERCRRRLFEAPRDRSLKLDFYAHLTFAIVEEGDIGAPLDEAIRGFESIGVSPKTAPFRVRHYYLAKAQACLRRLAALSRATPGSTSPSALERGHRELDRAISDLEAASSVPVLTAHLNLVRGLRATLEGRSRAADAFLSRAEALAREEDCPSVLQAIATARADRLLDDGNESAALREARIAYGIAVEQGYALRARELRSQFLLASQIIRSGMSSSDISSVNMQRQRDALLQVSFASATVTDPDEQTRIALDQIIKILHAERAFFFLSGRGEQLELRAARNASGADIPDDGSCMKSVVETVRASREPLVVSDTDQGPVRNIMAAPLMKGERLVGVIYLDTRVARGIFSEENLKILVAIANHVYVTLEATRTAQLEVYHRIAANVPGALYRVIVRCDGGLDVPFISNGCRELFGIEAEAIAHDAHRLIEALHPDDRWSFIESLQSSADSLAPWSWEGRSAPDNSPQRWIRIAGRPQRLTSGDTLVDGLLVDISERKKAEEALERAVDELARTSWRERERAEALKQAHERLVEANRRIKVEQSKLIHAEKLSSIGRLAAGVAHEINNPLTGVMACVEALESFNVSEDRRDQYFETIKDGLERMKSVVQSLLDFAAPHATEFEPVDVHPLVTSTLRLIHPQIMRRRVQIGLRLRRGKTWVHGNRSQLMQAVMNVLLNAVHASPQNGEIRIRTRTDGERVGIEIADHGAGIPEELLNRVCEPFFTTKPQGEGTGLGLAVTLGIMEAHHGELEIDSKPGAGTAVTLWLRGEERREEGAEERAS
jgi:signal transduction histidine kinase/tRNA A-37 threonylcarbamoyl transferase component Bud32/tetratricopeptide (TPR) repeat protein